jgi:XamI restriction endonuclease
MPPHVYETLYSSAWVPHLTIGGSMAADDRVRRPIWTADDLEESLAAARLNFVHERLAADPAEFSRRVATAEESVYELLEDTQGLLSLHDGEIFREKPYLLRPARYMCAPPISEDDFDTLTNRHLKRRDRISAEDARAATDTILQALDHTRLPWVAAGREPAKDELRAAGTATAALMAYQETQTSRRNEAAVVQQDRVAALLEEEGFVCRPEVRRIGSAAREIQPGQFSREADCGSEAHRAKADVPVLLRDDRLLLLECKVSNSEVNSFKRLNHETVNKARTWQRAYGDRAITGAVLSGVFRLDNVRAAQDAGVTIFWAFDLGFLRRFISAAS